jgi:hypothetical protein
VSSSKREKKDLSVIDRKGGRVANQLVIFSPEAKFMTENARLLKSGSLSGL